MSGEQEQFTCEMPIEYVYPSYLRGASSNFIRFTANKYQYGGIGEKIGSIDFYHPGNIAFADGASYATFDMGPIGKELAEAVVGVNSQQDFKTQADAIVNKLTNKGSAEMRTLIGMNVIKDMAKAVIPGGDSIPQVYSNVKGIAINPNTTASFSNMNIRTYVFTFKMIAENPKDSELIRNIQNFIRSNIYAEEGPEGFMLNYPSTFSISFHTPDGSENPYYPRIYECFMTNFQANYNASSHLHHDGGAPVEVDVSLTFQETKVLTKKDIDQLSRFVGGGSA